MFQDLDTSSVGAGATLKASLKLNPEVITAFSIGAPYFGGESLQIDVEVSDDYPLLVTITTMAINTNDFFTALNGVRLYPVMVLDVPGLDAGSEENNDTCVSI